MHLWETCRAATGTVRLRGRERERELVFTLRPGADARAEMTLVTPATRLTVSREQFEDLRAGDRVDHYRVTQRLDAGGMGSVYAVEHNTLGRTYALKVLHGKVLRRDPSSIDRFVREARAAARIQHPNIVDVFDFGFLPDGRPYFVMELLKGSSLADMIDTTGALPPAQAFAIARQLVEALCAAHDHGVIHADVTPSNVFVLDGDPLRIKLADFGLAELRDVAVRDNDADYIMGTPRYVAPEQLRGQPASEASDQYALGIVLFEMLAGDAPFNDPDLRTLCRKHLFDPIPTVQSPHGPLPTEVQALIARCLAKNPGERHPSMRAVRAELDEITRVTDRRGWRRWLAT